MYESGECKRRNDKIAHKIEKRKRGRRGGKEKSWEAQIAHKKKKNKSNMSCTQKLRSNEVTDSGNIRCEWLRIVLPTMTT
jgi:hypothetical protein